MRKAVIKRESQETQIEVRLNLDGSGKTEINTGIGFFDHLLTLFAFHAGFDLEIKVFGDLEIDDHHTVEDVGIVLGKAFKEALGDKIGISRYGFFLLPMDEALARVVIDISGRPTLVFNATFTREKIGNLSTEMIKEFFLALSNAAATTIHIDILAGQNNHHIAEAIFKGFGRVIGQAVTLREDTVIPSSKGLID